MSSKPQQICFKIIRKFINTSVLRETNGSNFETKLFASVPDIVNGHVVYWKAMRLGSVHFYDCFSPSTVFDLKRVRVKILNKWKHTKKTLQNHIYAPPPPPPPPPTFVKKILSSVPFYCVLTNQKLAWSQSLSGTVRVGASPGGVPRIFWGLKFSIPGIFWVGNVGKFFWMAWFKKGFFGVFKTIWRFVVVPAYPGRMVLRIKYNQTCY